MNDESGKPEEKDWGERIWKTRKISINKQKYDVKDNTSLGGDNLENVRNGRRRRPKSYNHSNVRKKLHQGDSVRRKKTYLAAVERKYRSYIKRRHEDQGPSPNSHTS